MICPLTDEEIKKQCRTHLEKHPWLDDPEILVLKHDDQDTNFVVTFSWPYEAIVQHRAWLDFFLESKTITVPKVDRLLEYGFYGILVTEKFGGQTLRQVMNGTPLSDEHADLIADTLQELRESVRPFENNKVTPLGQWTVQGHMFPEGETARVVDTVDEMASFLTGRFRRAVGNQVLLPPLEDGVFSYGNLSPDSIKLLSNGRLAFVDFNQSCMGPRWWDWYALAVSCEDKDFVDPLLSALKRKGLIVDEESSGVMDDLHRWYGLYGTVADIEEWKAILRASKTSNSTSPQTSFGTTQSRPHSPVSAPTLANFSSMITRPRPHSPVSMDNPPTLPLPPLAHDDSTSEEDDALLTAELTDKELIEESHNDKEQKQWIKML
ncbi:hypothetical protein BT96DRAFT_1021086 [Gymnopus androsaceus JB14]|uniref:Aminoglycoside phosphotransferase domain-containing protein n=1 Tax=Gymnopus androsaceus JB14 TaxID=1447944 RepID=A0A6A4HEP4_9AGAR|nr:hypothetical protein BT96DRAFT_1021086 [Gymnopus androsaceus JB14]